MYKVAEVTIEDILKALDDQDLIVKILTNKSPRIKKLWSEGGLYPFSNDLVGVYGYDDSTLMTIVCYIKGNDIESMDLQTTDFYMLFGKYIKMEQPEDPDIVESEDDLTRIIDIAKKSQNLHAL